MLSIMYFCQNGYLLELVSGNRDQLVGKPQERDGRPRKGRKEADKYIRQIWGHLIGGLKKNAVFERRKDRVVYFTEREDGLKPADGAAPYAPSSLKSVADESMRGIIR
jgi:hypothetical protein